jgi:HSP20 family protein
MTNELIKILHDDFFNFPAISSLHPVFAGNQDPFTKPSNMPNPDIVDFSDRVEINIPLAGYTKDKVTVTVEDGNLLVSADKSELYSQEEKPNFFYKRSLSLGGFKWKLKLNSTVEVDEVSAEMRDGILFIKMPKRSKQVKVIELR